MGDTISGAGGGRDAPTAPVTDDPKSPGRQDRPMSEEEELDEALEETFPASDPIAPSRIDGPGDR